MITHTILEKFKKVISTHLCLHKRKNVQLFSPSLGYRRIRIQDQCSVYVCTWGMATLHINTMNGQLLEVTDQTTKSCERNRWAEPIVGNGARRMDTSETCPGVDVSSDVLPGFEHF